MLRKILAVDDSALIHQMYKLFLSRYKNCKLISAMNGLEALERLGQEATREGRPQVAYFAAKLLHHARLEEEVLYPAAIVLGEYLKSLLVPAGTVSSSN